LNGAVAPPTRRLRDTSKNPYSKSYCKPLQEDPPSSAPPASRSSIIATTKASTLQINEDSPTIKQILAATGHASVEEFLASRDTNSSKAPVPNGAKFVSISNGTESVSAMNGTKVAATTKGSKSANSLNGSKASNGTKAATNTNRSKNTNSKKKATSK